MHIAINRTKWIFGLMDSPRNFTIFIAEGFADVVSGLSKDFHEFFLGVLEIGVSDCAYSA
jgi:hypothetical protein